jgi:DNA-binding NarL/FixJ family response regulator
MRKKLTVFLVDDNETFREAVRQFLEIEFNCEIVGEAENGKQFLKAYNKLQADIVLMDIQMPEIDGIAATKKWCMFNSQTKVIAVTMFTEKAYLLPLIEAGFKGCVFKSEFFNEITKAIETVMGGGIFFSNNLPIG